MFLDLLACMCFMAYFYNNTFQCKVNAFLIHLFSRIYNVNDVQQFGVTVAYFLIRMYSICQIYFNRLTKLVQGVLATFRSSSQSTAPTHSYSKLIYYVDIDGNLYHRSPPKSLYGYIFYDYVKYNTCCENAVFIKDVQQDKDNIQYQLSKVRFISVTLYIEDKDIYQIILQNSTRNYYIVGNCLNRTFFKYYLKHELKLDCNLVDELMQRDFKFIIVDDNVVINTYYSNDNVCILENTYTTETSQGKQLFTAPADPYGLEDRCR